MHSKIGKLAAAAVLLVAVGLLWVVFLNQTVQPVYALEQTAQALHSVRSIHIRQINPKFENQPTLIWAEFFEDGRPKAIRMQSPEWKNGDDGAKEIIWKDDAATVWFKKKKGINRFPEKKFADQILYVVLEFDPKNIVRNLQRAVQKGNVEMQTEIPDDKAEPIRITETLLPNREAQRILYVDQATKLLLREETYRLENGEYVLFDIGEFYDYNQPLDPSMFTFDNVPEDVIRVDQVARIIGLEQGQMTNDEVAIEVVRQFWLAIIQQDYEKAGQFFEGIPGDMLKQMFQANLEQADSVEIVSIGPVQPHSNPKTGGVIVPCTLRFEKDGLVMEKTFDKIGVRQVYNQPGRWTIFGGL